MSNLLLSMILIAQVIAALKVVKTSGLVVFLGYLKLLI